MENLTPQNIEDLLNNRLRLTLNLYKNLDTSDTEIYNIIYFKLYFDFSTAIECVIYNILFKKYGQDGFILKKTKIDSNSVSNYIPKEEIKLLIGDFGGDITIQNIKERFTNIKEVVKDNFYMNLGITKNLYDVEAFTSLYTKSRDTRNKLAHGLTLVNVDFNNKTLFSFMSSYFVLIKYYENLCNN